MASRSGPGENSGMIHPAAIERFHASPSRCVLAITGGGASLIGELLSVPGGSHTVLEAIVPYSSRSLDEWLRKPPDSYCSEATALAMATVAYHRAWHLAEATDQPGRPLGLGLTASLASAQPKKGPHRAHLAIQTGDATLSLHLELAKGARDRAAEEQIVTQTALRTLLAVGEPEAVLPELSLLPADTLEQTTCHPVLEINDLFHRRIGSAWSLPDTTVQTRAPGAFAGLVCGAFNPLHFGHAGLREVAEQKLHGPVWYELSIHNVDKPSLDYLTIDRRRAQFCDQPLLLTDAPTFLEKSRLVPGAVFVVGADTAERIIAPKYYGSEPAMQAALREIRRNGCRFLTAARTLDGELVEGTEVPVPLEFADLFEAIPASEFRADVTSTELRQR